MVLFAVNDVASLMGGGSRHRKILIRTAKVDGIRSQVFNLKAHQYSRMISIYHKIYF